MFCTLAERTQLIDIWNAFKSQASGADLSQFDSIVTELAKFETIRYPDDMVEKGMQGAMSWELEQTSNVTVPGEAPRYALCINTIDRLVNRLFDICSVDPKSHFVDSLNVEARKVVELNNPVCEAWFAPRVASN
jgi:hypothetical protein